MKRLERKDEVRKVETRRGEEETWRGEKKGAEVDEKERRDR